VSQAWSGAAPASGALAGWVALWMAFRALIAFNAPQRTPPPIPTQACAAAHLMGQNRPRRAQRFRADAVDERVRFRLILHNGDDGR